MLPSTVYDNLRIETFFYVFDVGLGSFMEYTRSHSARWENERNEPDFACHFTHFLLFFLKKTSIFFSFGSQFCRWLWFVWLFVCFDGHGTFGNCRVLYMVPSRMNISPSRLCLFIPLSLSGPLLFHLLVCFITKFSFSVCNFLTHGPAALRHCVVRPRGFNVSTASSIFFFRISEPKIMHRSWRHFAAGTGHLKRKKKTETRRTESENTNRGHIILITCSHQMR